MTLSTKRTNTANAVVNGSISAKKIAEKIEGAIKNIAKNIKLDGFRKGKVPANVIKSRYKEQVEKEAEQRAIEELLGLALKELNIAPNSLIGSPAISKYNKQNDALELEIKLSIAPNIDISKIDSFVPAVKLKPITDAQINDRLKEIALSRAPLSEIAESRALKNGDIANIDFEGFIDGKAFDGGKGSDFNLTIGSNQFIKGFEEALIGMKKGEDREIKVSFPKDYQAAHLAGKPATFKVKLHKIQEKKPQKIDDSFAKSVVGENSNLESFKDMIKEQLVIEQKSELYNKELKNALVEALLKNITFDLPELIIEQEMDILFRNALSQISKEQLESMQKDQESAKKEREKHRSEAKKSVQITFIMDALAKAHNIVIQDNEVAQTIYYEAMMSGNDPKAVLEHYQNNNLIPAIKMTMIEDRVLNYLLDKKFESSQNSATNSKADSKPKAESKPKATKSAESKADPKSTKDSKSAESKKSK